MAPPAPLLRLQELILFGTDVGVLSHTALSLWHFQQLTRELLQADAAAEHDDVERSADGSAVAAERVPTTPLRGVELGEGMSVAAVLYEEPTDGTEAEKSGRLDAADPFRDTTGGTDDWPGHRSLQGATTTINGRLTSSTKVAAAFHRYRCVLCLDASPSILSIDPSSGRLFLDLLYESVELFLWSMLRPMEIGGVAFSPELHVSVLVQGALVESLCVLMQGYIVTSTNAASFLQLIKERFGLIENDWACQAQERGQWGYLGNTAPASLDWVLQNMVFALNSLPSECAPIMMLVTDGVVDVRDVSSYDNVLMQLVRHDIQCHFLRIGGDGENELDATFGFVPDTHLLRFVSEYTGGIVFDYETVFEACYGTTSPSSNITKRMTGLQDALFLRKSSVHANSAPVVKLNAMESTSFDGRTLLPLHPYRMWREKVHEYRIYADVNRIVEARLREGFSINKIYVKTYQSPHLTKQTGAGSPRSGNAPASDTNEQYSEVTKFLLVFLLQWKQNVWLEYVVSTTTEYSAASMAPASAAAGRQVSGQGINGLTSPKAARRTSIISNGQGAAWSEWYVKMNILGYADFLRAFEDTMQRSPESGDRRAAIGADLHIASPMFVHDFIRNVQDVDRVLLHLMTATTSIRDTSDSVVNQFSFGTNPTSASANPKITSSHPVFNIIGDLSTVLWHRWFFLERFEILSVVKSEAFTDLFYRDETYGVEERESVDSRLRGPGNSSRLIHRHGASVYSASSGHVPVGIESLAEPLVAILAKWSSQKLSQDLFLKFLRLTGADKGHVPPRAKGLPPTIASYGGLAQRRRQRSHNSSTSEGATLGEDGCNATESKAALCFVRLEFKNKTLCAIHVAFFATKASTRRQVLDDLKSTIFAGVYEVAVPTPSKLLTLSLTETPVILCHRMLSRLFVTHDTLLFHGNDQKLRPFNLYAVSPMLGADKSAKVLPPSNTCCGGSELKLHRVFGAYVWHSSWKWEVPNLASMSNVMRRLHEARVSCGFWVLDWKIAESDDGQGTHVESVIFGREILMENENGRIKTALLQYGLRRVSDTCLMTSFWMEPQHGVVKTRLSSKADHKDRFHWSLKQAIGHDTPFENYDGDVRRSSARGTSGYMSTSCVDDNVKSEEPGSPNTDSGRELAYLDESELLRLIRGYLYKSDRHFLSCLYTFDCIIHFRENIELSDQSSKDIDGVVGSSWSVDRQLAAEIGMILPPFSTARLLATSNRSTEHFLMYLQCDSEPMSRVDESGMFEFPVSPANENLYSMLEVTLRGLSDCEVAWADYNGDNVANLDMTSTSNIGDDCFDKAGMDGQLPLWLKEQLSLTFESRKPHHTLSKGKCFAKLVSSDCVVLAFFPSLDTLQIENKTDREPSSKNSGEMEDESLLENRFDKFRTSSADDSSSQQFSVQSAEEDGPSSRVMRMSVSADDIVLYQERRRSFREGYKSWRMGHYQGSRDAKQSYGRDFRRLRLPSTPEDHEFCEEISRQAAYGCDFHLLIESAGGVMGSGFFQVAFYECSISRLSTDLHETSKQTLDGVDLSHTVLKHLFFSSNHGNTKKDCMTIPLNPNQLKTPSARSPSSSTKYQLSADSALESRRFRKKIKRAHEHNFSRGVYMALRAEGSVQHSDLLQALSSCIEIPVDFDVTLLYHMMEIAASQKTSPLSPAAAAVISAGIGADILRDKLTKSFETILSSVFAPITGTKYYYYTGNENAMYEDLSASECELHILMEDSDEDETVAESRNGRWPQDDTDTDPTQEQDIHRNVAGRNTEAYRHCSEGSSDIISGEENDTDAKGLAQSRRGSFRRDVNPLVDGFSDERLESEEQSGAVEEDAEFNKDVAVATSSFSVPFFLRFECRVLHSSRETRADTTDTHVLGPASLLRRSSSSAAYEDVRKEIAQAQASASNSRQEEFGAFLELLKNSQGSQHCSDASGVSRIAESFMNVPPSRIALRLVTMTLPNESEVDGRRVGPHGPFVMDTSSSNHAGMANALPSISPNFATLHRYQCQVLTRIRKDIKEWCSVEILSILKYANEITPAIGALVQRLFDDLPELAVTNAKYPLEFVASSQETPTTPLVLFKQEFERGDLLNVHCCNGVYFVAEAMGPAEGLDGASENRSDATYKIPYWAYFEFGAGHISLRLHHPDPFGVSGNGLSRLQVLTRLQLSIRAICRRVNQSLLLLQLHETRTCNSLLLPPDSDSPISPRSPKRRTSLQGNTDSMNENDNQTKPGLFFWPGQFECDLRYSAFFKLHERLTPNFALNMLCTSALEQFQVHNRRHLFVYRDRDGNVFYMKICISSDATLSHRVSRQFGEERQEQCCIAKPSIGASISGGATNFATATASGETLGILLQVFGVSEAGEEVTNELCHLLERKLDEATQVVLMKLLARNTKFQLSQSDLAFLCPPAVEPSSDVYYSLPGEISHCCVLLHYLSQTLKLASYIRPVTSGGSSHMRNMRGTVDHSRRAARRGSITSVENFVGVLDEESAKDMAQEKDVSTKVEEDTKVSTIQDSAHTHPACFGVHPTKMKCEEDGPLALFDAATRSPVFFVTRRKGRGESCSSHNATSTVASPEIVAQASYVMNLNPDLRLSQGFLSRVGKGLALIRVDLIRKNFAKSESGEDLELQDLEEAHTVPRLTALYSSSANSDHVLVARCQIWTRGSINATELSNVVKAFLNEAVYDYHIEETIKNLQQQQDATVETTPVSFGTHGSQPSGVNMLVSLFERACLLPSSSVTKLKGPVSIAPWDLNNVMVQVRNFLSCLPHHLRPGVYAKSLSGGYDFVSSCDERSNMSPRANEPPPAKFRLIVQHASDPDADEGADSSDSDTETTASVSSTAHHIEPLMRTDSIHSEISDIDSVSGRVPLTWASISASYDLNANSQLQHSSSLSSTTLSVVGATGGGQSHYQRGVASERDVLLYANNRSTYRRRRRSQHDEYPEVKRSFYYVVDLSIKKGLRLYGYNMSSSLVEALTAHIARVLTWSMLREHLLRSLLLEKSGLSTAAPVGTMVLQPSCLFSTVERIEQAGKGAGKNSAVLCKDSAVHFIEYRSCVLSILQSNEWFPRVLDTVCLRSIEGTSLGVYLREAQTQPTTAVVDAQYQRPRGKGSTCLGVSVGPPSIPDLTREVSGQSVSQRSVQSHGDSSLNLLGGQASGKAKGGCVVSSSSASDIVPSSSPSRRLTGKDRGETARMRGGAGATTALMAARARARGGGGFPNRTGGVLGAGPARAGGSSPAVLSSDTVAPWDLPLSNMKAPRLLTSADDDNVKPKGARDGGQKAGIEIDSTVKPSAMSTSRPKGVNRHVRRGSRSSGVSDLGLPSSSSSLSGLPLAKSSAHRIGSKETVSADPGRIHSSWKTQLEVAWGPRFMFPGNTERWVTSVPPEQQQHFIELEEDEDHGQPKKSLAPLSFFCSALEKRWEMFEIRSTNHTVGMTLLEKLASLDANESIEEPVAKGIVAHLMQSGHLLLHQRFRAAFVEQWTSAEATGTREGDEVVDSRLSEMQSCLDLVHLLRYKRKFMFDQDKCSVAKLYAEHTVESVGAGTGADVWAMQQQVAANMEPLRLEVASDFYKEYAVHLRTLGFRRLRTLDTSTKHARALSVDHAATENGTEVPGVEGFSEYFYHPEETAAKAGGWNVDSNESSSDAHASATVLLEVKCDNRGVRLTAVLVSLHDLEQQDLQLQTPLAVRAGRSTAATSGRRVYIVAAWLRAQLQTQALIYGFTIRYFQQHILQWINASYEFGNEQNMHRHRDDRHVNEDGAIASASLIPWKKAATFQNIVRGLQSFLVAFPDLPVKNMKSSAAAPTPTRNSDGDDTVATKQIDSKASLNYTASATPDHGSYRPTSRVVSRFARRAATRQHQQQSASYFPTTQSASGASTTSAVPLTAPASAATQKRATPLSSLWRGCVLRVATVALQPTLLQSNCSELILVQNLLRYIACHGSRYEVVDLLQFGTPDAVVCHSLSGSFFNRPTATLTSSMPGRQGEACNGYSLVITTQMSTLKSVDGGTVQLLLVKSTPSESGVGSEVLPVERALQEAQLFARELFRVATHHYERDLLWSRLLFDDSRDPEADLAPTLALPRDLFRADIGPQQLEECLRLSIRTPLEWLDPRLGELLRVSGVCWQELAMRLRILYADQLREFQFQQEDESSSHLLLLCPDTFDLVIHLTFVTPKEDQLMMGPEQDGAADGVSNQSTDSPSRSSSRSSDHFSSASEQRIVAGTGNRAAEDDVHVEICRREEPPNKEFTLAQRRSISEFVNSIVHWQWRSLIYD